MIPVTPLTVVDSEARLRRFGYAGSVSEFLATSRTDIVGQLGEYDSGSGFEALQHKQTDAWGEEIRILRTVFGELKGKGVRSDSWTIVLEYDIPRRGRRIDVILISERVVYVVEFKTGRGDGIAAARNQVVDYVLELADFHSESRDLKLIPVVVAEGASTDVEESIRRFWVDDDEILVCREDGLSRVLCVMEEKAEEEDWPDVSGSSWLAGSYSPTPTIIEAAQVLYTNHDVREIAQSEAGSKNLEATQEAITGAIERAQASGGKVICFVTGVPGAGKTLAGLNAASQFWRVEKADREGVGAAFFSGNGPLIKVLVEALARSSYRNKKGTKGNCIREAKTFIQNIHWFLKEYIDKAPKTCPYEKVIIFDEAQRAWDKKECKRKQQRPLSEPEGVLQVMDRHQDWAAVICLIGSGQEIHDGEAGLREWGRALEESFGHWRIVIAGELAEQNSSAVGQRLFDDENRINRKLSVTVDERLHLDVPIRSYRSTLVARWVEAVLAGDCKEARQVMKGLDRYPILATRSLDTAKQWLRNQRRGLRRSGLVASSGAYRLRPYGIDVKADLDVAAWFLNEGNDVRSSLMLEQAATEFKIQGLELDWAGLGWGADMRWCDGKWQLMEFRGTTWRRVRNERKRQYWMNKYRVLLTRAREGMVIWVPEGCADDVTCLPGFYDGTAGFLGDCGVRFARE